MILRFLALAPALALALAVSHGAIAQPAAAPDAGMAHPEKRQADTNGSGLVDQVPGFGGGGQLAVIIAQPGTQVAGLAFRMLSMTNGKVSFQPRTLQALDLTRND